MKEKREKKKDLDSTPATKVNTINLNSTSGSKKKTPSQIFYLQCNKKDHFACNDTELKKCKKLVFVLVTSTSMTEPRKKAMPKVFGTLKVILLQRSPLI